MIAYYKKSHKHEFKTEMWFQALQLRLQIVFPIIRYFVKIKSHLETSG